MSESVPGTVLITGAAHRIGRALALDMARHGWAVALHYHRSDTDAAALARQIEADGGHARPVAADLTRETEVAALVAKTADTLGVVDCLINNAAVFEPDTAATATRESWDLHMDTNLRAPFVLMQRMAAALPDGRQGNIINLLDERVWNLTPNFISYTVSKVGLWALTRTMAMALAPEIRVNAVGPGAALPSARQSTEQFARQGAATPLGHGTNPEEICDAVRFILAAPAMTGQMIALDGGKHLGWAHSAPGAVPDE
jgi:NAD(P)-dependent dehydrogenase (short-subunit alcohol dehydrogenase family)